ncbi:uncharacterized protein LOC115389822 [Salarias fasciatus]|uniref:uncharacterized protein LOC115389822 n=1 Tax=Salarias fasciatus TaxID=181472 RepID=UPI001176C795|nr:uncharacterized protein LOC115389822 [Salarias fasciatus]
MVQLQLSTLQQLMDSGFGRPFPRHGLQLLFWFANDCLTCEVVHLVSVMKLVPDCQPEKGFYGFHLFGNVEEILPVLSRSRNGRRKYAYFEVGNLNAETHPGSADLPAYVRENYELEGSCRDDNVDRLIIGYRVRTGAVEVLFVTEHDAAAVGRFRPDRTYRISWDLIRVLQSPDLDLSSFLTQVGYYEVVRAGRGQYPDPELVFNMMTGGFTPMTQQNQAFVVFSETFSRTFNMNVEPSSCNRRGNLSLHTNTKPRKPKPSGGFTACPAGLHITTQLVGGRRQRRPAEDGAVEDAQLPTLNVMLDYVY